MKIQLTIAMVLLLVTAKAQTQYVRISTVKGDITVVLYDQTPLHRDNFLSAIRSGMFKNAAFNRVIKGFVSQGGELDQTIEDREKRHPEQGALRVKAEIKPQFFHKRGALGEGRNANAEKSSFVDQLYFVEGKQQSDAQLDQIEKKTGVKFPAEQRKIYKSIGGTPQLDGDYTIFGEIVQGLDVATQLNSVATNAEDLPLSPLKFKIKILTKKEISQLKSSGSAVQ